MGRGISSTHFDDLKLSFDADDPSTLAYSQRSWHEEYASQFYSHVSDSLAPDLLIDVGANYGVASLFMKSRMPDVELVSIEPNPHLLYYITKNLETNGVQRFDVLQAVVGDSQKDCVSFHVNPAGSQDSRVVPLNDKWTKVECPQTRLVDVINNAGAERALIKIDSQGFEEVIFQGAEAYLSSAKRWLIKTEFAPQWIVSQGGDPVRLLKTLCSNYQVTEFPARYNYFSHYETLLAHHPIKLSHVESYIDYVVNLAKQGRGWVDLLVAPKRKTWWTFSSLSPRAQNNSF